MQNRRLTVAKSVVVFGMAHSGKSTCIGYMYNKTREKDPDYDFEKYVNSLRRELSAYDSSRDYGYLVDEFIEERIRTKTKSGTSKKIHFKPVELGDIKITVVDTPGSEHKSKQRQKGMYYGEVGIFCIEINQLTSEEFFTKKDLFTTFMATLILWSKFNRRTIIALTKMDLCDYQEESYLKGCQIINQLCDMINVSAIVPISINVKGRTGHNIYNKSPEMSWYRGKTLAEALMEEIGRNDYKQVQTPLLFYVDRSHLISKQYTGQNWRIKILQGEISVGQEIVMSPVLVNRDAGTIKAKVKSIRSDLEKTENTVINVENASEGSFVGIDLYDIRLGNRKISKDSLRTVCTSCGFASDLKYKMSNTFIFRSNFENFEKFSLKRQMDLLWFGRAITFQVISRSSVMNGVEVIAKVMNKWITMPITENGEFLIKDLIIRYDHNPNRNPYLEAELIDIYDC